MRQHFVERLDQQLNAAPPTFGFTQIRPFARQPKDQNVRAKNLCDVDRPQRTIDGVPPAFRIVAGVRAVHGHRAEPQTGRDHFRRDAGIIDSLLQLFRFFENLLLRFVIDIRHRVIVVEHHRVEPQRLKLVELPIE